MADKLPFEPIYKNQSLTAEPSFLDRRLLNIQEGWDTFQNVMPFLLPIAMLGKGLPNFITRTSKKGFFEIKGKDISQEAISEQLIKSVRKLDITTDFELKPIKSGFSLEIFDPYSGKPVDIPDKLLAEAFSNLDISNLGQLKSITESRSGNPFRWPNKD